MKVTPWTKQTLRWRRKNKEMLALGYEYRGLVQTQTKDWREGVADIQFIPGDTGVWWKKDGGSAYKQRSEDEHNYWAAQDAARKKQPEK